jgi:hypothetical protein
MQSCTFFYLAKRMRLGEQYHRHAWTTACLERDKKSDVYEREQRTESRGWKEAGQWLNRPIWGRRNDLQEHVKLIKEVK